MSKFPSKITMIISILLIAVFSSLKFSKKLSAQHFQLKFDWQKEKLIKSYGEGNIDSVSYNYLSIIGLKSSHLPDNQNTFAISITNGEKYYFRYLNIIPKKDTLVFSAVEWITGTPELKGRQILLTESNVPLKENKGHTIITIGDQTMVKDEAKYFRRKIAAETEVNFDGNQKDVFNYKHLSGYNIQLTSIQHEMNAIPNADIYILSWSSNSLNENDFIKKANKFINDLSQKEKTKKIIWINAPKVKNSEQNKLNSKLNKMVSELHDKKLVILDAYSLFDDEKKEYLMPDSIHLNKFGYEKLASKTVKLIK